MDELSIIPIPAVCQRLSGSFSLSPAVCLVAGSGTEGAAEFLAQTLAPATGFSLPVQAARPGPSVPVISLQLDPALAMLSDEGYRLEVSAQSVELCAAQPAGLFYAVQTLRQLLPPEIFSPVREAGCRWEIPCVSIEDRPRFRWRGAHLDVSRHFFPKDYIFKFIDLLALHKLNIFHWHLTDDQGWRIEIKRYPRLTEVGAWRKESLAGHLRQPEPKQFDGIPHGGFYTQAEAREVVAYAQARGIMVVPEIELPGHAQAAVAAYPELGNTGQPVEVSCTWGIHENIFNAEESTLQFLRNVLEEVLDLFPSPFIHIGGDEARKTQWQHSSRAQQHIRELGLNDEDELQSYIIKQMDSFLTAKGRRLVGWSEILEGGLAQGAVVMSWLGEKAGIEAARAGHDVIMTPYSDTYLDYYQAEDKENEPLAIGGCLTLEKVYRYDPLSAEIPPEQARHVLGSQGQLWTEYIPTCEHLEYMAFPRLCALAEGVWSSAERKDYARFEQRLDAHLQRLDRMGVHYRAVGKR